MDTEEDKAVLAKCVHCKQVMHQPVLCDACAGLNPLPAVADHFTLLGLPRRFDVDAAALHAKYVALSRHSHPDYHSNDAPEVRMLALQVSSAVNNAYRTLSDPVRRAGYLLELLGGPAMSADKSVPDGFLGTVMMLQEELQDAKAAGDAAALARLKDVLKNQQDGLMRRVEALFADIFSAASCEATLQSLLHDIRRQLNAVAYVRKMLSLIEEKRN
jgi:molecular chaperone HscB